MLVSVLKSKLAYVKVTEANLFYEGSITIDENWMKVADIREHEQVLIVNVNNGERLTTYAIKGKAGSAEICLNGPAARKGTVGDELIIITFAHIDPSKEQLTPTIIHKADLS